MEKTELEKILENCEKELLQMSLLDTQGDPPGQKFQTPVFRFIWLKLSNKIRERSQLIQKGVAF